MSMQTEFEFTLPRGFLDANGTIHKNGVMRLATAADEIIPMKDQRVQSNPAYLSILVLARVLTKLGTLPSVDIGVVEKLLTADLAFLQDMYERINTQDGERKIDVECPYCGRSHPVMMTFYQK